MPAKTKTAAAKPAPRKQKQKEESPADLRAQGKALRDKHSRQAHAGWTAPAHRFDPLKILEQSNEGRVEELVPIRYGRMLQSPFTFYRGAAAIMAADLAKTPNNGLNLQACGDCHLMNFGAFATPERRMIFDINDFDETAHAPWEWDVKRLAASFVLASRSNGHRPADARDAVLSCVRSYRETMDEFAEMRALDIWYASLDIETIMSNLSPRDRAIVRKRIEKARSRDVVEEDFPKMVDSAEGKHVIRDNPPLIYHTQGQASEKFLENLAEAFQRYRETLPEDRRVLLDRFKLKDVALKVVGVGSVGTRCGIMLLMNGESDVLFLQVKEARTSVLEPYAGKTSYANRGQRVVVGQRLMQSASDLFLGWTEGAKGLHYYVRQLRDMKLKPLVELFSASIMETFARYCGWVLARAHARSGQPALLAGYLGKSDRFDKAIASFAVAYADQNERDYERLRQAARRGLIDVHLES